MANSSFVVIKRETTFPLQVTGLMHGRLQKLLLFLLADKTQEEIDKAHALITENKFEEEWHEHFAFLSYMITYIEQTAHEKGLTSVENLETPVNPQEN